MPRPAAARPRHATPCVTLDAVIISLPRPRLNCRRPAIAEPPPRPSHRIRQPPDQALPCDHNSLLNGNGNAVCPSGRGRPILYTDEQCGVGRSHQGVSWIAYTEMKLMTAGDRASERSVYRSRPPGGRSAGETERSTRPRGLALPAHPSPTARRKTPSLSSRSRVKLRGGGGGGPARTDLMTDSIYQRRLYRETSITPCSIRTVQSAS